MKRDPSAPLLSAIFVDYDNIYLSLKRKNEDAAKRFSKDAALWLKGLEKGRLINSTGAMVSEVPRRVVLNRCYGNPVPRRNNADNSTDMSSFPFVRHHFLRAGFEIVDCPPLTSQQKNAADIRMVMDLRDYLTHDTYFDEFIILSGDADFTPVLHRLRQHARRTVIYSNDHTAAAYAAICDGEVRELDLISLLIDGQLSAEAPTSSASLAAPSVSPVAAHAPAAPSVNQHRIEDLRQMIMAEVVAGIRAASGPVPLEALADRALRAIGHERTIGTAWAGSGSFRELVRIGLPSDLRLTEAAPFTAYDPARHMATQTAPVQNHQTQTHQSMAHQREALAAAMLDLGTTVPRFEAPRSEPQRLEAVDAPIAPVDQRIAPPPARTVAPRHVQSGVLPQATPASGPGPAPLAARAASAEPVLHRAPAARVAPAQSFAAPARLDPAAAMQKTISRIHEACQAPPLAPADYRAVFEAAAQEISENGLSGAQTLSAIAERAQARGVSLRREDVRFILDVVSEPDPWFEQGATANLFAGRFRNFAVARCREQGLQLSADELDLIDAWFTGAPMPDMGLGRQAPVAHPPAPRASAPQTAPQATPRDANAVGSRWWALDEGRQQAADPRSTQDGPVDGEDDFPRIVRTRQRG
jgi:NYN domain